MRQKTTAPAPPAPAAAQGGKENAPNDPVQQQKRIILAFLRKLGLTVLALWAIFTFVFGIRQVNGETMYPRLRDGDLILYYRLEQEYHIDDVVAFQTDDGVKRLGRIVAQGGDVVDLNADGLLVVNGNVQEEEVFYITEAMGSEITYPYTVEADSYFVLCDFRTASIDSRSFGAVPKKNLDGKVITLLRRRGI
jgi:signal peptidase I